MARGHKALTYSFRFFHYLCKKRYTMTTIIINEKTRKGKLVLALIREMGVGRIIGEQNEMTPNQTTVDAMKEAKAGKTIKCSDFDDYLKKVH